MAVGQLLQPMGGEGGTHIIDAVSLEQLRDNKITQSKKINRIK